MPKSISTDSELSSPQELLNDSDSTDKRRVSEITLLDVQQGKRWVDTLTREEEAFELNRERLVERREAINEELTALQSRLVRERNAIESKLDALRKRRKDAKENLRVAEKAFKTGRTEAKISDELWSLYEKFCAAAFLKPDPNEEVLVLDNIPREEFKDMFINYDPEFADARRMGLFGMGGHWRCDRITTHSPSGRPFKYTSEFKKLKYTTRSLKRWDERFPKLYASAIEAAKNGSTAALEMLVALPDADDSGASGKLFEFAYVEPLDPNLKQEGRWEFRACHDLYRPMKSEERRESIIQRYDLSFMVTE
ncbi:hypothetical protein ANO14919_067190 [Xylariales sp. No.14919]|nr:hypothetical protein ANO14919_067190 [Xylariales sp. No.14919]